MGLKSVEMQVALPRTQDAGKMQDDAMRQNQQFQDKLTQNQLKQDTLKRSKVNEYDDIHKRDVLDAKNKLSGESNESTEQGHTDKRINHPYLGKNIDFSG